MGTAFVDNIKEHSTGHGVQIPGHVIQFVQKTSNQRVVNQDLGVANDGK